jgi:hypothetical protein
MDVIAVDWEKGIVICLFYGQVFVSLYEDGDLLQNTGMILTFAPFQNLKI